MRLAYFQLKGFRRIRDAQFQCGDATFLIGENNIGKSSVLKALDIFFSEQAKLDELDYFRIDESGYSVEEVVMEAKFADLPTEAVQWRGFKGRIFTETIEGRSSLCIYYRKTYPKNGSVKREMRSFKKTLKAEYSNCKTIDQYAEKEVDETILSEVFGEIPRDKNLTAKDKEKLDLISELWDLDQSQESWEQNPGGIEGVISVRLPKFLLIPADHRKEEIDTKNGTLQKMMLELFEDVRNESENYREAQRYLDLLAAELDPSDEDKEFGKMLLDVNAIIGGVFTNTRLHISTSLSNPQTAIKPDFAIEMSSNVKTNTERQGMGSIRSTVFALLHYREKFVERKREEGVELRPILIGFEEPEMYLHPNAASLMRDKIYELATSSYSKIICTTHSPYMIDLSKKIDDSDYPKQVLNLFKLEQVEELATTCCNVIAFNTTAAYKSLHADEKDFIKFILKIDDYVAKVFFCKKVIIVEGDTEEFLIKETVNRLEESIRKEFQSNYQLIKARGKATIISLVKYLKALGIHPFVIHDQDTEAGAIKFNEPILAALDNDESKRFMVQYTIEDILGYSEPRAEKPYKAYLQIKNTWGTDWASVPETWRTIFEQRIAPELFVPIDILAPEHAN